MSRRTKQSEFSARVDKNAVAYALKSVKGAIVRVEPRIEFMARRNDIRFMPHIRVQGDGPTHLTSYDYDVSVTLLCTAKQAATIGIRRNANPMPTIPTPSEEHDENQATACPRAADAIEDILQQVAEPKRRRLPEMRGVLERLIFSGGGVQEKATEGSLKAMRKYIGDHQWKFMMTRIAFGLLKARGASFVP